MNPGGGVPLPAAAAAAAAVAAVAIAGHAGARGTPPSRPAPAAGAVALASAPPQTVELTLPFAGIWGVTQGFDSGLSHVGYAAYALDFVPAEPITEEALNKPRRKLADHPCYGRPVLAPADGDVVWARDGGRDWPPLPIVAGEGAAAAAARAPMPRGMKKDPGNFVIIEHAPGEYTELRHLMKGSVRVAVGTRVTRGQEIARCGNSGNARTPHLHIGFLGSIDPIATRPMRFSRYQVLSPSKTWTPGDGVPKDHQILRPTP